MTLRTGLPGRARGREEVHGADHVDLVERAARDLGRVDDEVRVQDRVDLRGPHDAVEDRVVRVGAHELGALEREPGLVGVEADDRLDAVDLLELLREPAAPEGAEPGDEDAHARPSAEPHAAAGAQHVVEGFLDALADLLRLFHHERARVALLVRVHVEVHRRQHAQAELRGEVDADARPDRTRACSR